MSPEKPRQLNPPDGKRRGYSAWVCVVINQLAFPGLGTILAGRRTGYVQAAVMVIGFSFVTGFLLWYLFCVIQFMRHESWTQEEFVARYRPYLWTLYAGSVLSIVAWLWALASSVAIVKSAQTTPRVRSPGL